MKRRELVGHVTVGGSIAVSGCTNLLPDQGHRMWFLRITNGSSRSLDVTVAVQRSGEEIFADSYADIPSFQDVEDQEASYANSENIRFIHDEWSPEPGGYTIECTYLSGSVRMPVTEIEDFESKNIGVEITFLGGAATPTEPVFQVLEFSSESEVKEFLKTVTDDTAAD